MHGSVIDVGDPVSDFEDFPSGGKRVIVRDEDGQEVHGIWDGLYFPSDEGDHADPRLMIRVPLASITGFTFGDEWFAMEYHQIATPDAPPAEWSRRRPWWRRR